jgi:hypothetical protein
MEISCSFYSALLCSALLCSALYSTISFPFVVVWAMA